MRVCVREEKEGRKRSKERERKELDLKRVQYLKGSEALNSMSECMQGPMENPEGSPEECRVIIIR